MLGLKGFITNLGKYNEGYLVGEWVTFPIDEDELEEVFKRIGINEEYEEYFITDYDNYYDIDFDFGEYTSIDHINEVIEAVDDLSNHDLKKMKAVLEVEHYNDVSDLIDDLRNWELYEGMTKQDVAKEFLEGYFCDLPSFIEDYFDFESYADDYLYEYDETSYGTICKL